MELANLNWSATHLPMMVLYSCLNLFPFLLVEFVLFGCHLNKAAKELLMLRLGDEEERETVCVLERPKGQYIEYIGDTPQTLE